MPIVWHPHAACCWCGGKFWQSGTFWVCETPACAKRQQEWSVQINGAYAFVPTPRQVEFFETGSRTRRTLFGGAAGGGKALALDTLIPTPYGWTTMGQIGVGDVVFDECGRTARVVDTSDVHIDPTGTYRLTFDDGSVVVAGGAHKWATWTDAERMSALRTSDEWRAQRRASRPKRGTGKKPYLAERNARLAKSGPPATSQIRTTADIAATLTVRDGSRTNHAVSLAGAWECPAQALPIDPYVLGVWLGDGSTRQAIITSADKSVLDDVAACGYVVNKLKGPYAWGVRGLRRDLIALGVLGRKHVPAMYLRGSVDQRLALLQGLMDTDGTCAIDGQVSFTNKNQALTRAVHHLAASLGMKPVTRERRAKLYGKDCGPAWTVQWTGALPCFRLQRKLARLKDSKRATQNYRYIVGCERVPDVPVKCITVDSPSHQFLCGENGIPTHNSETLRWGAYRLCLSVPNFSVLILRKTYKELERTHFRAFAKDAAKFGAKFVPSDAVMKFRNGSRIEAGHCDNPQAFETYLSTEYDLILVDELVTLEEEPMIELMTRARSSKPEVAAIGGAKFWAGTNPGGRGALWVRDFFIARAPDPDRYRGYDANWYAFVESKVDDNPYVDVDYRANLQQLPEMRRRQLLDGDWTAYEGRFFGEFRATKDGEPWHVREVEIPEGVEWVGSMDWGYNSPGIYAFWACLPDGHYHRVYERKFQGMTADDVAPMMRKDIADVITARGGRLRYVSADPSMWNKTGAGSGEAIAETFTRQRIPMRRANNERGKNGWQPCHELLRTAPDGRPWLTIDPSCTYFLRTIPVIGQDPNDPDDVDTNADDHAADDFRYFARSRPSPTRRRELPLPKGALGHDLRAARTESSRYAYA